MTPKPNFRTELKGAIAATLQGLINVISPLLLFASLLGPEAGSSADGIWLLESGTVSILAGEGNDAIRLATFGSGQFVGEMGFIDGKPRSAMADQSSDSSTVWANHALGNPSQH